MLTGAMRQENDAGAWEQPRKACGVAAILVNQKRHSDLRDLAGAILILHGLLSRAFTTTPT
jgi:hypothetical protein